MKNYYKNNENLVALQFADREWCFRLHTCMQPSCWRRSLVFHLRASSRVLHTTVGTAQCQRWQRPSTVPSIPMKLHASKQCRISASEYCWLRSLIIRLDQTYHAHLFISVYFSLTFCSVPYHKLSWLPSVSDCTWNYPITLYYHVWLTELNAAYEQNLKPTDKTLLWLSLYILQNFNQFLLKITDYRIIINYFIWTVICKSSLYGTANVFLHYVSPITLLLIANKQNREPELLWT